MKPDYEVTMKVYSVNGTDDGIMMGTKVYSTRKDAEHDAESYRKRYDNYYEFHVQELELIVYREFD